MVNVLMISANEIKNLTQINYNVSDDYISAVVNDVQEVYLQEIIGTPLFLRLKELIRNTYNKVEDNLNDEINAKYNDFYQNFVKNYLKEKVEVELLVNINFKIRNMGVVKSSDKSVSGDELSRIIRSKETSVNHWATMLSKYLKESDFDEIKCCNCYPAWYLPAQVNKNYGNIQLWLGSDDDCKC